MFCPECGAKNHNDALFCENCGYGLSDYNNEMKEKLDQVGSGKIDERKMQKMDGLSPVDPSLGKKDLPLGIHDRNQKVRRKPVSILKKVILVEIVFLLIASFAFYKIGSEKSSPENLAIQFVKNINERNWNSLYDNLLLPKDQFLNKEVFLKSVSDGKPVTGRNYIVSEKDALHGGDRMTLCVDFMTDSGEIRTVEVNLIKAEKKTLLLFDKWEVLPDFVVNDYEIQVPAGAEVTFAGMELDESYMVDEDEYSTYYRIPAIFSGEYEISVSMEPLDDYLNQMHTNSEYFFLDNMSLNEEVQRTLMKDAAKVFKETYSAAFAGRSFNEIKHHFGSGNVQAANVSTALKEEYDSFVYDWSLLSTDVMKKLEVDEQHISTEYFIMEGKTNVIVYIDFDGTYREIVNGNHYSAYSAGTVTYNYEYANGEWNISGHDLDLNIY